MVTKDSPPSRAGVIAVTGAVAIAVVAISALTRHWALKRFPQVAYHYEPRPQDTLICSRPMDTKATQYFYPLFKHTYLKTENGTLGYQFCDSRNENCPDSVGSAVLPDTPHHQHAKDPKRHQCWLVSTDPLFRQCMENKMNEVISRYHYPNRYFAILDNPCATFADRVANGCFKDINQ